MSVDIHIHDPSKADVVSTFSLDEKMYVESMVHSTFPTRTMTKRGAVCFEKPYKDGLMVTARTLHVGDVYVDIELVVAIKKLAALHNIECDECKVAYRAEFEKFGASHRIRALLNQPLYIVIDDNWTIQITLNGSSVNDGD